MVWKTILAILAAITSLVASLAWVGHWLVNKSNNKAQIEIAQIEKKKEGEEELAEKYMKALRIIQDLRIRLTAVTTYVKTISPMVKALCEDRPEFIQIIEEAEREYLKDIEL